MGGIVQANHGDPALGYQHGFLIVGALLLASGALGLVFLNPERSRQRIFDAARRGAVPMTTNDSALQRAAVASMDLSGPQ